MTDIDFRHLQGAITVAEELNLSRAAERLGITQPALTKRMHDLEERLGVVLFNRTNRGVELTDPCRVFIEDARMALLHLDRSVQRARASAQNVEEVLHVGRSPYTNPQIITILTSTRSALYPNLRIELSGNFSGELTRQVLANELDLALITKGTESPLLNYLLIESSRFFVLFRDSESDLASLSTVALSHLDRRPWALFGRHVHPFLHDEVMLLAKGQSVNPSSIRSIQTAEEAAQLVVQFGGVAFLTQTGAWRVMEQGLTIRPLNEDKLRLDTVLITRAEDDSRLLSEYVRSAMKRFEQFKASQQQLTF